MNLDRYRTCVKLVVIWFAGVIHRTTSQKLLNECLCLTAYYLHLSLLMINWFWVIKWVLNKAHNLVVKYCTMGKRWKGTCNILKVISNLIALAILEERICETWRFSCDSTRRSVWYLTWKPCDIRWEARVILSCAAWLVGQRGDFDLSSWITYRQLSSLLSVIALTHWAIAIGHAHHLALLSDIDDIEMTMYWQNFP